MQNQDKSSPTGPHQAIVTASPREQFLAELFDTLWDRYRQRVSYVRDYEQMIAAAGATFVNDHIAFRTLASQRPLCGIVTLSRIFESLGYRSAGCYNFPDKMLSAIHYQHPNAEFPKLFISELRCWELCAASREIIGRTASSHRETVAEDVLAQLSSLDEQDGDGDRRNLLDKVVRQFHELPWNPPGIHDVQAINDESQYAAWVLVHGYNVNHFTSLINSHQVDALNDIEKTSRALAAAGVPMKSEIEGEPGSKLRQTATGAAVIDVDVNENDMPATMPWTYAYFELAERGEVVDADTGKRHRFEGFLGPQATQLFEMTRKT
jgi:hypothetical protein